MTTYGCWNRKPLRGHCTYGTDWSAGNPLRAVRIEFDHVMAKDCQYTKTALGQADEKCKGCKHKGNK